MFLSLVSLRSLLPAPSSPSSRAKPLKPLHQLLTPEQVSSIQKVIAALFSTLSKQFDAIPKLKRIHSTSALTRKALLGVLPPIQEQHKAIVRMLEEMIEMTKGAKEECVHELTDMHVSMEQRVRSGNQLRKEIGWSAAQKTLWSGMVEAYHVLIEVLEELKVAVTPIAPGIPDTLDAPRAARSGVMLLGEMQHDGERKTVAFDPVIRVKESIVRKEGLAYVEYEDDLEQGRKKKKGGLLGRKSKMIWGEMWKSWGGHDDEAEGDNEDGEDDYDGVDEEQQDAIANEVFDASAPMPM